jgi:hypothetical protein
MPLYVFADKMIILVLAFLSLQFLIILLHHGYEANFKTATATAVLLCNIWMTVCSSEREYGWQYAPLN